MWGPVGLFFRSEEPQRSPRPTLCFTKRETEAWGREEATYTRSPNELSRARPRGQVSSADPGALSNLLRDLLPKILRNGPRGPLDHFHREQDPCIILPHHPRTKRAQGPLVPAQPCHCIGWNLSHVTLLSLSPSPVKWGFKKQDPGWLP